MAQAQYRGTGRRKNSTARVILVPGTGKITINKKSIEEYIPFAYLHEVIKQPLNITETIGTYDVLVNVNGGGFTGQSGAIRHGIARALLTVDPDFRGNGVGKKLMRHIEKYAIDNGISFIRLSSANHRVEAHKFYENIGYKSDKLQKRFIKIF